MDSPKQTGKSIFEKKQAKVPDDFPKLPKNDYIGEVSEPAVEIMVPSFEVVNQRIFCVMGANKMVRNPRTGLFEQQFTKIARKDGSVTTLPRLFVAKCAPDIFIETANGKENILLEPGTEVFPFWPEMEGFSFPLVKDPDTLVEYTVLHWTELSAYSKQKEEKGKKEKGA